MNLKIGHLYKEQMSTYGDSGNVLALKRRCEWRGIKVNVKEIKLGQKIEKGEFDLYFFGGGQDQVQIEVANDLVKSGKGKVLREELEKGVPLLSICGGYQLLGEYYQPQNGEKLEGLGFFPAYTIGSDERMIGNILVQISDVGDQMSEIRNQILVGFENHSGKTYLEKGATPLGKVVKGFGNNGEDKTEGCIKNNAIGCYMHGSLLPKNPEIADWLIKKALEVKYSKKIELKNLADNLEQDAHSSVISSLI